MTSGAFFCDPDPCRNGATCHSQWDDYWCQCPVGYTGKNCEVPSKYCNNHFLLIVWSNKRDNYKWKLLEYHWRITDKLYNCFLFTCVCVITIWLPAWQLLRHVTSMTWLSQWDVILTIKTQCMHTAYLFINEQILGANWGLSKITKYHR